MGKDKYYKAFISYSHDDEEFGSWLHKELEKYKIPKKLQKDYTNLPKTLYPIFRDRYELNAGDNLGIEIPKALKNSDALIIICSTSSANSKWVNKEIIEFKTLHGEDRIFPIIIDGEPFARESDKFDDSLECFPDALKYKIDSNGNLTNEKTSILASNIAKTEDGRELAKLKLIAGILGVPFGEFHRRDISYKEEELKRIKKQKDEIEKLKNIAVTNEQKMKKELFNNKIQRGIQERDFLHNPLKEKLFFAEAISLSSTNKEAKISKILYNHNKSTLLNIYEHNTSKYGCWGTIFSENEEKIVSWSGNSVKLWNINSGKVIVNIEHNDTVQGAIFNKDNTKILSWSDDKTVRLWDSNLGRNCFTKQTPTVVYNAFFNKKEDAVICWGNNHRENKSFISYFKVKNKKKIYEKILNTSLNDVILDEDNILYWGTLKDPSNKGYLKIDDIKSKKNLISLEFNNSVHGALYNKNKSKLLIWTSYSIKIFDLITSKIIFSTNGDDWILNVKFNNNEDQILALYGRPSNWQKNVKLWSTLNSKKPLFIWEHDFSFIHGAIFNKDNTKVLTYGDDGNIKLWSTKDGVLIKQLNHKDKVAGAKFLDNDKKILSWTGVNTNIESNNESLIYLWDIDSYKKNILFTIKDNGIINDIKVSKDEKKILTYGSENLVKLWFIRNSKTIKNLNNQEAASIKSSYSKKIDKLTYYYNNFDIKIEKLQLPYDSEDITHLIFNHKKNKVLLSSNLGDIILWDLKNKKEILKFSHSEIANINGILFSLDEKKIFSWGEDGSIKLWDIKTKKLLKVFQDEISIKNIILSKNNSNKFYSWSGSTSNIPSGKGTVRIWDIKKDLPIQILRKDINGETGIDGISLNQDETLLISWMGVFNLDIWNIKNGTNLLKLDLDSDVEYAEFINNDKDVLIIKDTYSNSKNIVQILHLYDEEIPNKFYILKTQVETGTYLTPSGEIKALNKKEWLQKKKQYEQILKDQSK